MHRTRQELAIRRMGSPARPLFHSTAKANTRTKAGRAGVPILRSFSRPGLAAMEVMLSLAALVPVALLLLTLLWSILCSYHAHVGNMAGSPLM